MATPTDIVGSPTSFSTPGSDDTPTPSPATRVVANLLPPLGGSGSYSPSTSQLRGGNMSSSGKGVSQDGSLTFTTPPGGTAEKKGGAAPTVIVQNIFNCLSLQTRDWLKIFASIALVVSLALAAFLACYTGGLFHFEKFLGPIGSSVCLSGSGILVVLTGSLVYLSCKV